jgi:hypothetical protein
VSLHRRLNAKVVCTAFFCQGWADGGAVPADAIIVKQQTCTMQRVLSRRDR